MRYLNVGSGSKGNSTLIYTSSTLILIDCGLTKKRVVNCLTTLGKSIDDIDAMFITHRHSDHTAHITSFKVLSDRTYSGDAGMVDNPAQVMRPFSQVTIKDLKVTALPTSHDAPDSMGYLLEDVKTGERMMYMTDTGYIPYKDLSWCQNCDFYLLESNHDPEMLMRSDRSNWLKMRILGDKGHLSNEQSSHYLSLMVGKKTREVALAHLSGECNTPQKALDTFNEVFLAQFGEVPSLTLKTLKQDEPTAGGDPVNPL